MLKTKIVEALQSRWNEQAVEKFMEAGQVSDAEAAARTRGMAEQLAICANELKKAGAEG